MTNVDSETVCLRPVVPNFFLTVAQINFENFPLAHLSKFCSTAIFRYSAIRLRTQKKCQRAR